MAHLRLGCQTITWDNERYAKRDYTVEAVAKAGYEGVEIGARFLDLTKPNEFKQVLDRNGIRLIAVHTGWNPFLDKAPRSDKSEIDQAIEFAQITKTPFLAMSGKNNKDETIAGAEGLNAIGEQCRKHGMTFCYHNHWWEIEDDARVLSELEKRTDPALVSFCPDIGWIRKTTPKVMDALRIIEPRIRLAHLKDYVADGLDCRDNETEFGQGILDFNGTFAFLKQLPVEELWVIAEQWKSTVNHLPPEESIRANHELLSKLVE